MTAQINIINSRTSVIASDSAVTIYSSKVFNEDKKIFGLGKNIPVGILISGHVAISYIPWERLIGLYETNCANIEKDYLAEYVEHFIDFIENSPSINKYIRTYYSFIFWCNREWQNILNIKEISTQEKFKKYMKKKNEEFEKQNSYIQDKIVNEQIKKSINNYLKYKVHTIQDPAKKYIRNYQNTLKEYFFNKFMKTIANQRTTLVFTGFGKKEIFPSTVMVTLGSIFNNKLINKIQPKVNYEDPEKFSNRAVIMAFAQEEGASLMMSGISKDLQSFIFKNLQAFSETMKNYFIHNEMFDKHKNEEEKIEKNIKEFSKRLLNDFQTRYENYKYTNYTSPIIDSVEGMPEKDMIDLAKTLVNLTSKLNKYSVNRKETAGGTINVASISKENGMVFFEN